MVAKSTLISNHHNLPLNSPHLTIFIVIIYAIASDLHTFIHKIYGKTKKN